MVLKIVLTNDDGIDAPRLQTLLTCVRTDCSGELSVANSLFGKASGLAGSGIYKIFEVKNG